MQESFLHYIWQFQFFHKKDLKTIDGDPVEIFAPGIQNFNSGPDFTNARIRIGSIDWVGNVEIHTKASGWLDHGHATDPAYDNVILHVVWSNDKPVLRNDGTSMPTLELKERVDDTLITRYRKLVENGSTIPCEKLFPTVREVTRFSMFDKALIQRLETKAELVLKLLTDTKNNWEETTYQLVARNFGFKINHDPFFQLANSIPHKLLLKHADNLTQIEALLFGQSGFLDFGLKEDYPKLLQREHKVLSQKYGLDNQKLNRAVWKFMRLRPANFPTIRIAQFAALFYKSKNLFSHLLDAETDQQLRSVFEVNTSEYWHHHYRFGRKTVRSLSSLGKESVDNLIINTVSPLLVAYGRQKDNQAFVDRAVYFLQQIRPEKNKIVKTWEGIGVIPKSAFDSQALIELHNHFCLKRRCLSCAIGNEILKPE